MSRSEKLTLAALVAAGVLLCGAPLGLLLRVALAPAGALDPGHLLGALEGAAFRRALWNSLDSAFFSALLATLAGAALAAAVALTDIRMKAAAVFLLLLPMMIPPHVTAIAWIKALGPSSPLLAALGMAPPPGSTHPLYSREGVIALLSVQHAPLAFLTVRAALRALPRDLIEAARVSGA
ncbi:MAG: ABC transporter permease subunit, partial [Rubrimonas sp.]